MNTLASSFKESVLSAASPPQRPLKRRKLSSHEEMAPTHPRPNCMEGQTRRWRTESEHRIYSARLVDALQRVRRNSSRMTGSTIDGKQVQDTANRLLALTAKGRTRWSRAILSSKLRILRPKRIKNVIRYGSWRRRKHAAEKQVKTLKRLVPGCRKLSFPNLLEEVTDYAAALGMQVRAMKALADLLCAAPRDAST